jgi:hypothetical protein
MKHIKGIFTLISLLVLNSCATYKAQYTNVNVVKEANNKELAHSIYLIGDAGNSPLGSESDALIAFKEELSKADKNSTAIFLGDNIYPNGLPKKNSSERDFAEHQLNVQIDAVSNFKGRTIFLPGNHDWYNDGLKGLKRQENFIEEKLGKNTFLPENGCPIENIHISEDIELIILDTQWYITNWDKHPTINDDCEIKTRALFLDEFKDLIKKARSKTTMVAMHHPMYSNGPHGGQFTFGSHMLPVPILGTLKNTVRKTGGVVNVDMQNKLYNELRLQLITLAQENDKTIFVSGHEHSLQYIIEDNLRQIISGSGSKVTATRNVGGGKFSYGAPGYSVLDIYKDGSSEVRFYSTKDGKVVYQTQVIEPELNDLKNYPKDFPKEIEASIYSEEETTKSNFYKFLWGERYRKYFSTKVKVPTVDLDTMFGGLEPVRKGGGNQSKSLRLEDKNGAQYVMRALRKNAVQYLQALIFKDQYIEGQFEGTSVEDLLLDVFAGSHPYAPFVIGDLADAVGIYHTNPVLYYVPKQNALGRFNDEFGGELYMIEEHTSEGHSELASFGYQNTLLSTEDMMDKIHKDEDIVIDEEAYIRARLFDMLIGDWDRHHDQWRWIEFKENGKKVYRPLPRDRDQAFSIMADGFLLSAGVILIPDARLLRKYEDDLVDVEGVNVEPFPLDMELIQQSNKEVWDAQVKALQEGLTDEVIDQAFLNVPEEVRDHSVEEIKRKLRGRRKNLQAISDRYYNVINKYAVVKGTDKDDWFDIERLPNGQTKVTAFRIKDGEKSDIFHERTYNKEDTKEIWIYGLDDEDEFRVFGEDEEYIKTRIVGGQNNDTYNIENGRSIVFYDYKTKKNTVVSNKGRKKFRDDYESNIYDYKKLKNNTNTIIPSIGANPDDGFRLGIIDVFTKYGFERNPFTSQHAVSAVYYFATEGFDLKYKGEFANILKNMNFGIELQFNSPNYAINFFGYGNESPNPEADEDDGFDADLDYNRTKIRTFSVMPSLIWRGHEGGKIRLSALYESNEVSRTDGRFIATLPEDDPLFDKQDFYGVDAKYQFLNKNDKSFPTLGMLASLQLGYKNNLATSKGFGYLIPELQFDYHLDAGKNIVLATHLKAHINLGDQFEFYQAATIGANNGLRGFRNERFTGKTAFVQSTDIRWNFTNLKTGILPLGIGVFGGFDYGRVWIQNDTSDKWNNSIGGGIFTDLADMISAQISAFNSDDGLRLAFRLGFGF